MKTYTSLTALIALLLVAISHVNVSVSAQDNTVPRFEPLDECFIEMPEGVDFDCGYVIVPEFHGEGTENTISLGVVRLNTPAEQPGDPMFLGAGGPGGSVMQNAARDGQAFLDGTPSFFASQLTMRDMVYVAQRGTSNTEPVLDCPALDEADEADLLASDFSEEAEQARSDAYFEALQSCVDAYPADGINLSAYNSVQNAADFNAIREVLGYDQMIYYGQSYGTLLGQHIMRDYPEALSLVILDGVSNIAAESWIGDGEQKFERALDYLLSLCDADPACAEAYPDTVENINIAYEMLEEDPFAYEITEDITIYIDGDRFASGLHIELYVPFLEVGLPSAVQSYVNGEPNALWETLMAKTLSGASGASVMMHFAVVCAEDPIRSFDDLGNTEGIRFQPVTSNGIATVDSYQAACEILNVPELPGETDEYVVSDIPVLLLHGALDPITPRVLAEPMRETLTTSYSIEFPYSSHIVLINNSCAGDIASQFIADPMTEPDTSCLADEVPLEFPLPENE